MALSVVYLYVKILPRTNCKNCRFPTCDTWHAGKERNVSFLFKNKSGSKTTVLYDHIRYHW